MNITLNKKTILGLFLFIWIIFSITYIVHDQWTDFQTVYMMRAYEQGKIDTINTLILEAKRCQPITVTGVEERIQIIKINCPPIGDAPIFQE